MKKFVVILVLIGLFVAPLKANAVDGLMLDSLIKLGIKSLGLWEHSGNSETDLQKFLDQVKASIAKQGHNVEFESFFQGRAINQYSFVWVFNVILDGTPQYLLVAVNTKIQHFSYLATNDVVNGYIKLSDPEIVNVFAKYNKFDLGPVDPALSNTVSSSEQAKK